MKADYITVESNLRRVWFRNHDQHQPYRLYRNPSKASLNRLMDLSVGDTVNVLPYLCFSGIGLEIHRNKPRLMPVSDPRSAAWKAGKDNKAAYPAFRRGPAEIITTDRPIRYQDDHPSLTAGERNK